MVSSLRVCRISAFALTDLMLLFIISLLLSGAVSFTLAYKYGHTAGERFHICLAVSALQVGGISEILSLIHQLRPLPWLGMQLLLGLATGAFLFLSGKTSPQTTPDSAFSRNRSPDPVTLIQWIVVAGFLVSSGARQLVSPITGFDERMYHASRVLYWIQNHSIFPYPTHNDRQVFLTFGSELWFLWPVLLTQEEILGRLIFWLGFPLLIFSLYFLLVELRASSILTAICLILIVSAPLLISVSTGLKPEIWTAVYLTGTAFWVVRVFISRTGRWKYFFFCGLYCVLSANAKLTALTLLPVVLLLPLIASDKKTFRGVLAQVSGLLTGLLLCGMLVPLCFNLYRYGHLSGSRQFQKIVSSDLSAAQLYTHSVRLTFLMLEPPLMPAAGAREFLTVTGNRIIALSGARQMLPLESDQGWPGTYAYAVASRAEKFSSGGLLWLLTTLGGLIYVGRKLIGSRFRFRLNLVSALMLLQASAFFGIVFLTRWMAHSQIPQRFLISVYPLGIVASLIFLRPLLSRRWWLTGIFALLTLITLLSTMRSEAGLLRTALLWTSLEEQQQQADEPFAEVLSHLPPGSAILLVGSQDIRDYPLFAPRKGYANRVISWGKASFDEGRLQQHLQNDQITHILIQNDQELSFHWDPNISTREMVLWLSEQSEMSEISLAVPGMRLFRVTEKSRN